jgi:hypothetical protein
MRPLYFIALVLAAVYIFHTCDKHEKRTGNLQYIPMELNDLPEPPIAKRSPKKIETPRQTAQVTYHTVILKRSPWSEKSPSDHLDIDDPEVVINFEEEAAPELLASNKSFD